MSSSAKYWYATKLFGLPEAQIRYYGELTKPQTAQCHYYFGVAGCEAYIYAVKRSGDLVWNRELLRPAYEALNR